MAIFQRFIHNVTWLEEVKDGRRGKRRANVEGPSEPRKRPREGRTGQDRRKTTQEEKRGFQAHAQPEVLSGLGRRDVAAGPANLGKHIVRHPTFELVSFRLAGAKHEHVEAGFVDDVCLTLTP